MEVERGIKPPLFQHVLLQDNWHHISGHHELWQNGSYLWKAHAIESYAHLIIILEP